MWCELVKKKFDNTEVNWTDKETMCELWRKDSDLLHYVLTVVVLYNESADTDSITITIVFTCKGWDK